MSAGGPTVRGKVRGRAESHGCWAAGAAMPAEAGRLWLLGNARSAAVSVRRGAAGRPPGRRASPPAPERAKIGNRQLELPAPSCWLSARLIYLASLSGRRSEASARAATLTTARPSLQSSTEWRAKGRDDCLDLVACAALLPRRNPVSKVREGLKQKTAAALRTAAAYLVRDLGLEPRTQGLRIGSVSFTQGCGP
jgi:hypothetical protein